MESMVDDVISGRARWCVVRGEALRVLRELPDECIDALITDPPYSSGGATRGDRMASPSVKYVQQGQQLSRPDFAGDNRDQRSFLAWCALWLAEALRVSKPGAPICVFTDWRQLPTTTDAVQAGGWVWRGIAVWDKTEGARPQLGRFRAQAEFVVWGSKGPMSVDRDVGALPGVWSVMPRPGEKRHITGKTPGCMLNVVRICQPGGVILDPFFGAGSTGIAALRAGYRVIGVELTEAYHRAAVDWMSAEMRETSPEAPRQTALFGAEET
ncbi:MULTISPECIES: DNA methyltransferase [Sorangium]|uniref:Methyltransferase n=1 Tax=Sorangium cellulosum TaxID=56 RepID=A0A4P2QS77_SORCE|nr:DNA methyltransferase [Sorangium sp. Soce836]AUX33177.1 DNA methyltransferase [Sorangium cellulosum]AUX33234.1 DNA methyltransferase [Sorangium cellulosum]WCQ92553.1 Modification methylase DpnIIB [Sorangium sp. Soce836]